MNQPASADPYAAVNAAIQNLMANRLGRAFVPLGLLFAWGMAAAFFGGGFLMPVGALASSAATLAYGQRIVHRAFGRPNRPWMTAASMASVLPPMFGVYVLGWLGLRGFALGFAASTIISATLGTVLGVWTLRSWMRIVEIERLARVMTINLDGEGGTV